MHSFSQAIAYVLAHWDAILGALGFVAWLVANVYLPTVPMERRQSSAWLRLLDRLCVTTMQGAANKVSAPLLGRSLAEAAREVAQPGRPAQRDTLVPCLALLALGAAGTQAGCSAASTAAFVNLLKGGAAMGLRAICSDGVRGRVEEMLTPQPASSGGERDGGTLLPSQKRALDRSVRCRYVRGVQ